MSVPERQAWGASWLLAGALAAVQAEVAHGFSDATSAWTVLGRPTDGVHVADGWVVSCFQQPIDPSSAGFKSVEITACKQEALLQLVARCAGEVQIATVLRSPLRETVEDAFATWYGEKLNTAGVVWVQAARMREHDLAVVALPETACDAMPKRSDWKSHVRDVAAQSESWIITAAIAELADPKDLPELRARVTRQIRASIMPVTAQWPEALIRLPHGIPTEQLSALGLGELAQLACIRPGDTTLWSTLANRCGDVGLKIAAEELAGVVAVLAWPKPAEIVAPDSWAKVDVGDLPPALIAVVRMGGAVPANPSAKGDAEKRASDAFAARNPNLGEAEALARAACGNPSPDALNLLAALRLADANCSRAGLLQALAFSTQAVALDADHPFARINVVRAMQRLGWREQVQAAMKSLAALDGAWQRREIERLSAWVRETDSTRPPESKVP